MVGYIKRFALIIAVAGFCLQPAQSGAEQGDCDTPELQQMDFWLGEWDLSWQATDSMGAGRGHNSITRTLGCVIEENFTGDVSTGNLIGRSLSTFHAPVGKWRQTWVDNAGGYFALIGGMEDERFILTNTRLSERAPHRRMVFEDITSDSITWRWQHSEDGEAWSDQWVINYVRSRP
nr:hypothetical protein [Nitrosomonas nitrosa]